jgi:hypothetical protein
MFSKLKEMFSNKEHENLIEPITEEIVIPKPVITQSVITKPVTEKLVASKPVIKKTTKKSTNKK